MVYFVVGYTDQLGYLVKTKIKISITQIDSGALLMELSILKMKMKICSSNNYNDT